MFEKFLEGMHIEGVIVFVEIICQVPSFKVLKEKMAETGELHVTDHISPSVSASAASISISILSFLSWCCKGLAQWMKYTAPQRIEPAQKSEEFYPSTTNRAGKFQHTVMYSILFV